MVSDNRPKFTALLFGRTGTFTNRDIWTQNEDDRGRDWSNSERIQVTNGIWLCQHLDFRQCITVLCEPPNLWSFVLATLVHLREKNSLTKTDLIVEKMM